MNIPDYLKNNIERLSMPPLSLNEELKLAERMENCRNLLLKRLYNKILFNRSIEKSLDNLPKGNRAGKKGQSWIDNITIDSMMPQMIKGKINKYLKHPTFNEAKSLNLDYSFVAKIAGNYNEKYNNLEITKILKQYYKARDYLIGANIKQLLPYCYKYSGNTPFEDVFQTLYLAMINASGKYSKYLGFKFGTLATWFVHNEAMKLIRGDFPITIPHKIYAAHIEIEKDLNRKSQIENRNLVNPLDMESPKYISEMENEEGEMVPIFDIVDYGNSNNEYILILKAIIKRKMQNLKKSHQYILSNLIGLDCPPVGVDKLAAELKIQPRNVIKQARYALKKLKMTTEIKFPR